MEKTSSQKGRSQNTTRPCIVFPRFEPTRGWFRFLGKSWAVCVVYLAFDLFGNYTFEFLLILGDRHIEYESTLV